MASLSSSKSMVVEKPSQEPLKCPRCDSSNTKFCYYNNYSLSQPRHFCKACKRYWTRGGTLRNVPVGGGCRKNKRVKRQPPSHGGDVVSKAVEKASSGNPSFLQPRADLPHSSSIRASSLLYSLPNANSINPLEFRFPFSGLTTAKFSSDHHGFDLQHQVVSGLGIGFSSSTSGIVGNGEIQNNSVFKDLIQDHVFNNSSSSSSSSPLLNNNNNNPMLFGSSSSAFSTSTSTPSMASLLASTIQQHNYANGDDMKDVETRNNFRGLMSYYEDISAQPSKLNGQNELSWDSNSNPNPNLYQISRINSSDPDSSLLWNTSNVSSAWFDPSNNMGSSVPSLI